MSKPDSASSVPDLAAWLHAAARDLGADRRTPGPPEEARDTFTAYLAAAVEATGQPAVGHWLPGVFRHLPGDVRGDVRVEEGGELTAIFAALSPQAQETRHVPPLPPPGRAPDLPAPATPGPGRPLAAWLPAAIRKLAKQYHCPLPAQRRAAGLAVYLATPSGARTWPDIQAHLRAVLDCLCPPLPTGDGRDLRAVPLAGAALDALAVALTIEGAHLEQPPEQPTPDTRLSFVPGPAQTRPPTPAGALDARWVQLQVAPDALLRLVHDLREAAASTSAAAKALPHPLRPLLVAYLATIQPDTRQTGILPHPLARVRTIQPVQANPGATSYLTPAPVPAAPGAQAAEQAYLPGLAPSQPAGPGALPFQLWDLTGQRATAGRGAPYALRLFIEAILSAPQDQRDGRRVIALPWRELRNWLFPGGSYRARKWPEIQGAFASVSNAVIEWASSDQPGAPGGLWKPVVVRNIPRTWNAYEDPVVFDIELPPGSAVGPLVHRPLLRLIGQHSRPGYRLALSLAYLWDRHGAQGGEYVQATRPRLARSPDGHLVDRHGAVIRGPQGRPLSTYTSGSSTGRRLRPDVVTLDAAGLPVTDAAGLPVVARAARERNPAADRYPVLTDEDLVALAYAPTSGPVHPRRRISRQARGKQIQTARRLLMDFVRWGWCVVEAGPYMTGACFGWEDRDRHQQLVGWHWQPGELTNADGNPGVRILPPAQWGAGWTLPASTGGPL